MPSRLTRALLICSVTALAGCTISTGGAMPDAVPASTTSPLATSSTSPERPPTEPAPSSTPDVESDDPVPSPPLSWPAEQTATAELASFVTRLQGADRYLVDRTEQEHIGGREADYLQVRVATVVDIAQRRAAATQTYAVSSEQVWSEMASDDDAQDELRSRRVRSVVDFAAGAPQAYLTFGGPDGWAGTWVPLDPAQPGETQDVAIAAGLVPPAGIAEYAQPFSAVAALTPVEFTAASGALAYEVPAQIATTWMPARTVVDLAAAGVDVHTLTAPVRAIVRPVEGGIEAVVELAPLFEEAALLIDDGQIAAYYYSAAMPVTIRVHGLGTDEPVRLPAPDRVFPDEPPA